MKAIILCGGLGTRLRPLTYFNPKPMVRVQGKPVLEHLVDYLYRYGVNNIIVNLHHLPDRIYKYFGTRLLYSFENKLLGEEGTIRSLQSWINRDYTVVMNGDTLQTVNLHHLMDASRGGNVKLVQKDVYAGIRIIKPDYYEGQKQSYYQDNSPWYDIGTWNGLMKAEKEYRIPNLLVNKDLN